MSAAHPTAERVERHGGARLPAELTAGLLAKSDRIAGSLAKRLATTGEIELPAEFRTRAYLRTVVQACRDGINALLVQLHEGGRHEPASLARLGRAGERQAEMSVPLEVLLSAYRLAARVVWSEVIGEAGRREELEPATVLAISEEILDYLDQISGAVGRAYLDARERIVRQRDRDRDRIMQRLLAGDVTPDLRRLAASLDLDLAPPYRVLACAAPDVADADTLLLDAWRWAAPLLVEDDPGMWIALVRRDADVRRLAEDGARALRRRRGGSASPPPLRLGAGPVAARLDDVAEAARHARRALAVGTRLAPDGMVHDDREAIPYALLDADPAQLRLHVEHVLGPLLGAGSRSAMLLDTLEALVCSRGPNEAATRLGIHRHTVVYRLQRIRDLLGVDLDDPQQRHRLWLALQASRLLQDGAPTGA